MTTRETQIEALSDALVSRRLEVERVGDTLNVRSGPGRFAHRANADLEPILDLLDGAEAPEHRRMIGGWANGVKAVVSEPPRSRAAEWSYQETVGRLMPSLEVETFIQGVEATGQESPWHTRFAPGVLLAMHIDLDRGYRPLTKAQVDAWGVTSDRIYSAARSILFHKTRDARLLANDPRPGVHTAKLGDGHDAARAIVLTEVFFLDLEESTFRFAIPHQDTLYYTQSLDPEALEALADTARAAYDEADAPLSQNIHALQATRPATARVIEPSKGA